MNTRQYVINHYKMVTLLDKCIEDGSIKPLESSPDIYICICGKTFKGKTIHAHIQSEKHLMFLLSLKDVHCSEQKTDVVMEFEGIRDPEGLAKRIHELEHQIASERRVFLKSLECSKFATFDLVQFDKQVIMEKIKGLTKQDGFIGRSFSHVLEKLTTHNEKRMYVCSSIRDNLFIYSIDGQVKKDLDMCRLFDVVRAPLRHKLICLLLEFNINDTDEANQIGREVEKVFKSRSNFVKYFKPYFIS
jgi:hypothetical protein